MRFSSVGAAVVGEVEIMLGTSDGLGVTGSSIEKQTAPLKRRTENHDDHASPNPRPPVIYSSKQGKTPSNLGTSM